MAKRRAWLALFGALVLVNSAIHAEASGFSNRHVLIIGIDGTRSDALQAARPVNLMKLASEGSVTFNAYAGGVSGAPSQQPTVSGPGWSSVLTGVWTDKHKVTGNSFSGYDSTNYPVIFRYLKQHNPSAYLSSIVEWAPIDTYLMSAVASDTSFRQVTPLGTADLVNAAVAHLGAADPDVLFLHFDDVDIAGHSTGFSPSNPIYLAAIRKVDDGVGTILAAIRNRPNYNQESWLILVTTDHGGTGTSHGGQSVVERTIWVIASGGDTAARNVATGPGHVCIAPSVLTFLGVPIQPKWGLVSPAFGAPVTNRLSVYLNFDNSLDGQGETSRDGQVFASPPGASARYTNGVVAQAASFRNSGVAGAPSDWAVTLGSLEMIYSNSFSFSFWTRVTNSAPAALLANQNWNTESNSGWTASSIDGQNFKWSTGVGSQRQVDLNPPLLDGGWHLVSATFNRGANEVTAFLDGIPVLVTNVSASGLATLNGGLSTLIGADGNGTHAASADIDDLGIWNRALAPEEIAEIMARGQQGRSIVDSYVALPVMVLAPQSQTVTQSYTAQLTSLAVGKAVQYQWQFAGTNLPGATSYSLTYSNVGLTQAGDYRLILTNSAGAVTSAPVTLTVVPIGLPVILNPPVSQSAFAGGDATFSVNASGGPSLTYQWQLGGSNLLNATARTLIVASASAINEGNYRVVVSNIVGAVTSSVATLTIVTLPPGSSSFIYQMRGYYDFESHSNGLVANLVRAGGYPGFPQDDAVLRGGDMETVNAYPVTTDSNRFLLGTGALDLNGTSAYGAISGNPVNISQDWSISAWFKPDTGGSGYSGSTRAFIFETSGGAYPISFGLRAGSDANHSNFQLFTQYATGSGPNADYQVPNVELDKWHSIIIVRSNATLRAYLDGALSHQIALTGALNAYSGLRFGTYRSADGRWFKGQIDDAALWNRALTASEISLLVSGGLQRQALPWCVTQGGGASLKTNLTAYYGFDAHTNGVMTNGAIALGGTGFANDTVQLYGTTISAVTNQPILHDAALARVGQGTLLCDGTNNYAQILGNPVDPNQSWSVAAWFKPDTGGAGLNNDATRCFVFETSGGVFPISFGLRGAANGNQSLTAFEMYTQTTDSGPTANQVYNVTDAQVDRWHHILLTWNAATWVMDGYLDGELRYHFTFAPGTMNTAYSGFNLGTYRSANGRWFEGLIDEAAFWQRALSATEAQRAYKLGSVGASLLTPAPRIYDFSRNLPPQTGYSISWQSVPGLTYTLEASSNLLNWTTVVNSNYTAISSNSSILLSPVQPPPANAYYDPGLAGAATRFYRVCVDF